MGGVKFDSYHEAERYVELRMMERAGVIHDLRLQVPYILQESYTRSDGRKIREIKYIADFVYEDKEGRTHVEDAKGVRTEVYKLKKKLFEKRFCTVIEEV